MMKNNDKLIIFDMDGTIADLYNTDNWSERLDNGDATVYADAKPMVNMPEFHSLLNALRIAGYKVIILSWLSKNDNPDFHKRIITEKKNWIKKYNIPVDDIIITKYGVNKHDTIINKFSSTDITIFDDDITVRASFSENNAVDPQKTNINQFLRVMLSNIDFNTDI
jgi:hypothetical protein